MKYDIESLVPDTLDMSVFRKLRIRYIVALSAIAIAVISSEVLVRNFLEKQLYDSRLINIAGRQRMLSQKLTKEVLLITSQCSVSERKLLATQLDSTLGIWEHSHHALQNSDSAMGINSKPGPTIDSMFLALQPYFQKLVLHVDSILLKIATNPAITHENLVQHKTEILKNETIFLKGMDEIVFQFDREARHKVDHLISTEAILLLVSLFILFCELIFIFTPIARNIQRIIAELMDSEVKERRVNSELRKLYEKLEVSQNELRELYYAVDEAIMFARTNLDGKIDFISDKFMQHIGRNRMIQPLDIFSHLRSSAIDSDKISEIISTVRNGNHWRSEVLTLNAQDQPSWLMVTVVPIPDSELRVKQLGVVCTDINERKNTEEALKVAMKDNYERKMAAQKIKSSLILEGQETERRRISRDIHDGIGQLLTGLKFQVQAIDWNQPERAQEKMETINQIVTEIIQEVRRVSYNLTPTVLNDYGFVSAVNTLINDMKSFVKCNLEFENITDFNQRLDKNIEINIFRIIQESLNNALKHSQAENILVSVSHDQHKLIIAIEDDGVGFTFKEVWRKDVEKMSGRGIFNMKERAGFIGADLEIDASKGNGTTVKMELTL